MMSNPGIFDYQVAEDYLKSIDKLEEARGTFCPAKHNDRKAVWEQYAINMANAYKYKDMHGDWYEPSCRGQAADMPGQYTTTWGQDGTSVIRVTEWPESAKDVQRTKEAGFNAYIDWWQAP